MLKVVMLCEQSAAEFGQTVPLIMFHLLQGQIIFELLYMIKALFVLSPPFNEKMLDNLLCIIHQIMTCT